MRKGLFLKLLDRVEKTGNKLPDPLTLFFLFSLIVVVLSGVFAFMGLSATHPDGRLIAVQNLLSVEGIRRMLTEAVRNFTSFPPLGMVLVTMIGIGVAERSGLITAALKRLVTAVPASLLTATLVFSGVMSSMAADAGYVVLTPLGAVLFASIGRHPLAGLAAAFAGVSGGFSANLLLTSLDPLLAGLSTSAAQLVAPDYVVQPTANYYFMIASVFMLTIVGTWVNTRLVEPRLGKWKQPADFEAVNLDGKLSAAEKRGLWGSGITFIGALALIAILLLPENGFFRHEGNAKVFYESLVIQIMAVFLVAGIVYGIISKTIKSDKDVAKMMGDSLSTMGGYIVLAFIASQFVAYFNWSNLGVILAINGAEFLKGIGATGIPLLIGFILVSCGLNLFIGSASAKWAVMAPVFVPMFMMMGYSPELTQSAYRIGDSVTNIITPLLPYFPVILFFAKRYDPKIGLGTLISSMLPYSICFLIAWLIMFAAWIGLGIPLGPGVQNFVTLPN